MEGFEIHFIHQPPRHTSACSSKISQWDPPRLTMNWAMTVLSGDFARNWRMSDRQERQKFHVPLCYFRQNGSSIMQERRGGGCIFTCSIRPAINHTCPTNCIRRFHQSWWILSWLYSILPLALWDSRGRLYFQPHSHPQDLYKISILFLHRLDWKDSENCAI